MTVAPATRMQANLHLQQQATVSFTASQLWPLYGAYARFGNDLPSFAEEVTRRLREDGYVGFTAGEDRITVIPFDSVKRIDFALLPPL